MNTCKNCHIPIDTETNGRNQGKRFPKSNFWADQFKTMPDNMCLTCFISSVNAKLYTREL